MNTEILNNENSYRLTIFIGGLVLFWALGLVFRFRSIGDVDRWRWLNNLGLTVINSFLVRVAFPFTLVAFAVSNSYGVMQYFNVPIFLNVIISVLVLDAVIYGQHLLFHINPFLWRLHSVHHSDIGFDVTTALRFHPIEIGLSLIIKGLVIMSLGVHPVSILIFEILLNFSAMFNHSNFSLPTWLEKFLSRFLVTPDFHRIHHSIIKEETNSNFGFFLSLWDFIFGTARLHSKNNLKDDVIGLEQYREVADQRLDALLLQPFKGDKK